MNQDGKCPFCGTYLDPSSPICPSCRRNIFQTHIDEPGGEKIPSQRPPVITLTPRNLIIGAIIIIVIASIPFIAFLNLSKNTSNPPSSLTSTSQRTTVQPTEPPTQPVPTPSPTSIPTPSPTSIVAPTSCQADWSSGMNGWAGSSEWKAVGGKLLSDGTNTGPGDAVAPSGSDSIMAPCQLSTTNYAVEAKIQILDHADNCYLAIRGRVQTDGSQYSGYFVGFDTYFGDAVIVPFSSSVGFTPSKSTIYSPGLSEHTYRAEFRDNQITLKIDNSVVLQAIDNKFITAGLVGLENGGCQISVSSFQATAL